MSILPRELASRYEVLGLMGEGGMGAVYKVRHNDLGRICVIKVMQAQLQNNSVLRDRFLREAQKGAQINHPNIAAVHEFYVGSNGTACLVMEYIDGTNLAGVLAAAKEPLDYRAAADIVSQALEALTCLHGLKIVHRDISPDNLMITHDAAGKLVVKLIDLGIAKSLEQVGTGGTAFFVGKFAYAPPEQFGNQVDTRSDIYSMGVVLYQLLTKCLPIEATDFGAYYLAHLKNELPRPFSATDPKGVVPESVRHVVLKALAKKPPDRFQIAEEFQSALQRAVRAGATTVRDFPATEEAMTSASSAASRRRTRTIGITAGSVVLAVFGAILGRMLNWVPDPWPATQITTKSAPDQTASSSPTTSTPSTTSLTVTGLTPEPPRRDPKAAAAAVTEGKKLADAGDFRAAYDAYGRATKADPSSAYAWANLGAAAAKLGRTAEANDAYEQSLSIDPDNWLAHYNFACLLARAGRRDDAYGHVERAIDQLRRHARSPSELESFLTTVRNDDALKELRNERRFTALLATN
jgi:serine/threonine-protein kinase